MPRDRVTGKFPLRIALLTAAIFWSACAHRSGPEPPAEPPEPDQFAGKIRLVNAAEYYVVFESLRPFPEGRNLNVIRQGRSVGRVRVTQLSSPPFQTADILDGSPQRDDLLLP